MDQKEIADQGLPPAGSVRRKVYDCIVDLLASNRPAGRQSIALETGLKFSVVDDHVKRLKDDGLIISLVDGFFEPLNRTEDRAVSVTFIGGGRVKFEIGDLVEIMTLREARYAAMGFGGIALLFGR